MVPNLHGIGSFPQFAGLWLPSHSLRRKYSQKNISNVFQTIWSDTSHLPSVIWDLSTSFNSLPNCWTNLRPTWSEKTSHIWPCNLQPTNYIFYERESSLANSGTSSNTSMKHNYYQKKCSTVIWLTKQTLTRINITRSRYSKNSTCKNSWNIMIFICKRTCCCFATCSKTFAPLTCNITNSIRHITFRLPVWHGMLCWKWLAWNSNWWSSGSFTTLSIRGPERH